MRIETMDWYYPGLDPDTAAQLAAMGRTGGRVLDLGTGPGTQAVALARMGFQVTATDISESAIGHASDLAAREGVAVDFKVDDILAPGLENRWDLILDRGCYHCFTGRQREAYVKAVASLLQPEGWLLLKCLALKSGKWLPNGSSPEDIRSVFQELFEIESVVETVYHGPGEQHPAALFCVLRLK